MEKENAHSTDIANLIERLSRIMRAAEHEAGLNPVQWQTLRYLARCNQFSNSPTALRFFLVATKGTVSQTIKALEQKKLLDKQPRPGQGRSVILSLTLKGRYWLRRDPWRRLSQQTQNLGQTTGMALYTGLRELLSAEISSSELKTFGVCQTCRFFRREPSAKAVSKTPYWCTLLETGLNSHESRRICAEHKNYQ